jgi:hypothetical protein
MSIAGLTGRLSGGSDYSHEGIMKYLCLVYFEEPVLDEMNGPRRDALTCEALDYISELRGRDQLLATEALLPVHTAVSVRVRNGRFSATDGPFAETKEQLGGFVLIDAVDLNDALQIVSRNPLARFGTIEVRPIMPLERRT